MRRQRRWHGVEKGLLSIAHDMTVRLFFAPNMGPRAAKLAFASMVPHNAGAIRAEATKRLHLNEEEASSARLFVWSQEPGRGGIELLQEAVVDGIVRNDDLVAVSLGEAYAGPANTGTGTTAGSVRSSKGNSSISGRWLRWEARPLIGSVAVTEWSDARTMCRTLGRMSTLLEHPACARSLGPRPAARLRRVDILGTISSRALQILNDCDDDAASAAAAAGSDDSVPSAAERAFLGLWRARGQPEVLISFVKGEVPTLRHELCHALYALVAVYRQRVDAAWRDSASALSQWMTDLGYHVSRHADEFGAYLLTEEPGVWRGRVPRVDLNALRARLVAADVSAAAADGVTREDKSVPGLAGIERMLFSSSERQLQSMGLDLRSNVPREDFWHLVVVWSGEGSKRGQIQALHRTTCNM